MTHTISASPFIVLLLIMRHLTLILFPYTTLFRSLSRGLPRLLQDGRRRLHRPGRLCLGDDARRRRDQRRGPPPVDRPDRGSAGQPQRRRRMRRDRRRRRAEGPGAAWLPGAKGGRRA